MKPVGQSQPLWLLCIGFVSLLVASVSQKWNRFRSSWGLCQCENLTSRLQKIGSNPVPFLIPLFHLLECTSLLPNTQKSAKQALPKSQFLSCQRSLKMLHADNDSNNIVLTTSKTLLSSDTLDSGELCALTSADFQTQSSAPKLPCVKQQQKAFKAFSQKKNLTPCTKTLGHHKGSAQGSYIYTPPHG